MDKKLKRITKKIVEVLNELYLEDRVEFINKLKSQIQTLEGIYADTSLFNPKTKKL